MLQIFVNANYDFIGKRHWFYSSSLGAVLLVDRLDSIAATGACATASTSPAAPWSRCASTSR